MMRAWDIQMGINNHEVYIRQFFNKEQFRKSIGY
jgi:hypothetical protein